jgi:DNA-binding response OmpR family regulator
MNLIRKIINKIRAPKIIAIVDDNVENKNFLETILVRAGYQLFWINAEQSILQKIKKEKPNLIILSAVFNGKKSLGICARIKRDNDIGHIPILVVSEQNQGSHVVEFYAGKADVCLVKPFSSKDLLGYLDTLLKGKGG